MKCYFILAGSLSLVVFASSAAAQQSAAPYTFATRYNEGGQITATISPDPDGGGVLAFKATRNTYGTTGATKGLLVTVESGELSSWQPETVAPIAWSGFAAYLTTRYTYDSYGRVSAARVIGSDGFTIEALTQFSYDDWDRVNCKAVRMNKAVFPSPNPNPCQLGAQGSDGPDRITRYTYDKFDQILTEERAVGTPLQQAYVTNNYYGRGVLRYQKDAKGNHTELDYDANWRLEKRFYPSPTSPGSYNTSDFNEYHYDNNGNVTYERKRNNKTITYWYDGNNRLWFKDLSDNTYSADITYNHDLRGLTLSSCFGATDFCTSSGEGETNAFNGFGDLASRTSRMAGTARTLAYQYDLEGNRSRVTHTDGVYFSYGRDGLNRVCSIGESISAPTCTSASAMFRVTYRPSGGRLDFFRPNGATTNINLDNALRLLSFTQNFNGTTNDLTNSFQYNTADQITRLSQSNPQYTYNQLGSRTGIYQANGLNQISSIAGSSLSYDLTGNLTRDNGANMTYTYDMENRLVATSDATSSALVYDVLGRLSRLTVNGTTTQFLYDGDALIGEYVGSALQRRYVHADHMDEPLVQYNSASVGATFRRYLHTDHQRSVVAHSDSTGNASVRNSYDSYGIPAATNDGRFGFTGQTWLREIGLNYYKARMYSAKLGRFLQTDPIFYQGDMNIYAYTANDPINCLDPNGLAAVIIDWGGGNLEVRIPVTWKGDATHHKTAVTNSVEAIWSGTFGKYQVTTKIVKPDGFIGNNDITITRSPTASNKGHSYVTGPHDQAFLPVDDVRGIPMLDATGQISVAVKGVHTPAHEAGHLLGLPNQNGKANSNIMDESSGGTKVEESDIENLLDPNNPATRVFVCDPAHPEDCPVN